MPGPVIGIDLGTTNSVVAVSDGSSVRILEDDEGEPLTPSVVAFPASGDILVGRPAREQRMVDAKNTVFSIKRLMGLPFLNQQARQAQRRFPFELIEGPDGDIQVETRKGTHSLPEISSYVLRKIRSIARKATGAECTDAVVTVPANFNELQRTATRDAAHIAGLNVLRILNEPTAAALAYGVETGKRERIAVYDLGGGTFDISILMLASDVFQVVATAGDSYLGGDDIDALIADRMAAFFKDKHRVDLKADPQAYERLRLAAEWLKCELSTQQSAVAFVEGIATRRLGGSLDLEFELSQNELTEMCYPLLGRAFDICNEALRMADLRPEQFGKVILVGGSTRSPQVRSMVAEYFGQQPLTSVDADHVVAQGAALQAFSLSEERQKQLAMSKTMLSSAAAPPPVPPRAVPAKRPDAAEAEFDFDFDLDLESPEALPPAPPPPLSGLSPAVKRDAEFEASIFAPSPEANAPPPLTMFSPLLMDVSPRTLGVVAAGGYCHELIERNAPIPTEETSEFTTSQDGQTTVRVPIYQGEGRMIKENQELGAIELLDLRPAPRGQVTISVTFIIDADGTLSVKAKDTTTGKEQSIRINLNAKLSDREVGRLRDRQLEIK
jgi:molecular chaperone DnaK